MLVSTVLWFHEVSATLATSWTLACDWNYRHSTRGTWASLAIGDENILNPTFENTQTRKGKETPQRDVAANVSNSSFRKLSWHRKCTWNLTPHLGHTLNCIFLGDWSRVWPTTPNHYISPVIAVMLFFNSFPATVCYVEFGCLFTHEIYHCQE